ncbi:GGDEF domain-containing protein [Mycobacterium malmoense]|uniref:GGDEF domain-containing protein n=2 Tax=Mycobacterium malmoense TaxID=1780 RepID=A0ABX3SSS3_MYCMA|nr:GGDEF domain-containing protein [Mycobacterium malmoense]ORA82818.1 GGDEF domain-containing protein [Mycobacterium malmoense]QZA18962.1 GGDEF domain-containing protein [Mycobacterium malmoense]UNB95729.1 GGDEF domain-containing protein [Mycobacterium malmoense]
MSMVRQSDQYDWLSAYLKGRGLQPVWRWATFGSTASQAALPLVMLYTPAGPDHPTSRAVAVAAAAFGGAAAMLWLLRWPTRRQSILYSLGATAAIAATCLSLSNPYAGLMGCATFAILGGFVAYFHAVGYMLANFGVAAACAAILSHRLLAATGDVALTGASLITVGALNVGVPFGIQSLVHTLRSDLRSSERDPLTGLHNRRSFYDSVYELMMLHHRSPGTYLVVAVIDLDNFKRLNDTRGHAAGDQALVAVAGALQANCRSTAVVGRTGGEEFVVADTDTRPDPAQMAERLRRAIAAIPFQVTASIGTSSVPLDAGATVANTRLIDDLISTSDAAMYEAKHAGGNRVCHHSKLEPRRGGRPG